MTQFSNKYDLEERTAKLGERIILFCRELNQDAITRPLNKKEEINILGKEVQELTMIFQKITSSLRDKKFEN